MSSDANSDNLTSLQCPAEWHIFDWYNGSLKADEKFITRNLSAATNTDAQRKQLVGLSDNNIDWQLSMAKRLKGMLASPK